MDLQLKGKTALVTGSTAGIGLAIAQSLASEGARVIVNGRTQERVDAALAKLPAGALGLAADLGTAAGVVAAIERFPTVDILINNLGIFEPTAFENITDARNEAPIVKVRGEEGMTYDTRTVSAGELPLPGDIGPKVVGAYP